MWAILNQWSWDFEISWSSRFVVDPPLWGGLWGDAKSTRAWNIFYCIPCGTPCRFVHPYFLGPSDPQTVVWCDVGWSCHYPPIRVLRFHCSWGLKLWCKAPITVEGFKHRWLMSLNPPSKYQLLISCLDTPQHYGSNIEVSFKLVICRRSLPCNCVGQ